MFFKDKNSENSQNNKPNPPKTLEEALKFTPSNLSEDELNQYFTQLIQNSDLQKQFDFGEEQQNYFTFALQHCLDYSSYVRDFEDLPLKLTKEHFNLFLDGSNLKHQDQSGKNAFMYACQIHNSYFQETFSENEWNKLIEGTDFLQQDSNGKNALMYVLENKTQFSLDLWYKIIERTDFLQQDSNGKNAFMHACEFASGKSLPETEWNKIIKQTDFLQQDSNGKNALIYALENKIQFSQLSWAQIIHQTDLNQIKTRQNLEQLMTVILDNKVALYPKTLETIIQNIQNLSLEDKKKINTDFQYFVSEIQRTQPTISISQESQAIITNLQILNCKIPQLDQFREQKPKNNLDPFLYK
jgi:hypothetical protein